MGLKILCKVYVNKLCEDKQKIQSVGFWLLIDELFQCFTGQDHSVAPCCVQNPSKALCICFWRSLTQDMFLFKNLMCISKCSGQVGLGVTLRSLESYQRRLRSQHLFSCRGPPKCSSNVFVSTDVCFHLFFRVSATLVEFHRLGQILVTQKQRRQQRVITCLFLT